MPSHRDHAAQARSALLKAREHVKNIKENAAFRNLAAHFAALEAESNPEVRRALIQSYEHVLKRNELKVLRQFSGALIDLTNASTACQAIEESVEQLPRPVPVTPPAARPAEPELAFLPKAVRGCSHYEHEGGSQCGKEVYMLERGRPSTYCAEHLRECRNPQCPLGKGHRIPARFEYCLRCERRSRPPHNPRFGR